MARLEIKATRMPDERRPYGATGEIGVFHLEDSTIARLELKPGWRWSKDVGPMEGATHCSTHHEGYCVSGRLGVRMEDGEEREIGPGDLFRIEPGHDAWVVGNEPCVAVDFTGLQSTAPTHEARPPTEAQPPAVQ